MRSATVEELHVSGALRRDIHRAVDILKEEGCTEVLVFGSVVNGRFDQDSDIDIAVRGCPPERFFHTYGRLLLALSHPIDLIDLDTHDSFADYLVRESELVRIA